MLIPEEIDESEVIVRGIVRPLFCSKRKLTRNAFLPPRNRKDVSTLRLNYTSVDFCKTHTKTLEIANNAYCGLAAFKKGVLSELNRDSEHVKSELISTPLDSEKRSLSHPVNSDMPGLPMHADMMYNLEQSEELKTDFREYAQSLIKKVCFVYDEFPESSSWDMGEFILSEFN